MALRILFLSHTYVGSVYDIASANATPYPLPDGSELVEELGFLGYEPPGVRHTRPIRKPKRRRLTAVQKAFNWRVARRRSPIEHAISSVKRCRPEFRENEVTHLETTVLAVVQGLTEFLPISSSAHLVLYLVGTSRHRCTTVAEHLCVAGVLALQ